MAEQKRRKTKQLNFRLPPDLSDRFWGYCEERGLSMQQFFENAVRQALGEPMSVPPDVFGVASHNKATVSDDLEAIVEKKMAPIYERLAALEEQRGKPWRVSLP